MAQEEILNWLISIREIEHSQKYPDPKCILKVLNICVFLEFIYWSLIPNVKVSGGGALGGDQVMGLVPLQNRPQRAPLFTSSHVRVKQQDNGLWTRSSPDTEPSGTLDLPHSRTIRNKYCLSHQVYGIFVTAAEIKTDIMDVIYHTSKE